MTMVAVAIAATAQAQDKNLKVSGYVQIQNQWGQQDAALKVGAANADLNKSFNRVGIRRGRIKFAYEKGLGLAAFQLDLTDKGVGLKDAWLGVKKGVFLVKGGIFDRPFGYEISYSSSQRESPERSTIFQTLFPEERDLGAALTVTIPNTPIKFEGGLFAGNGIKAETDSRKDFIGHLSANHKWGSAAIGGGLSYYYGSVWQGTSNIYKMSGKSFTVDHSYSNTGKYSKREYFGADVQLSYKKSKLHAEFLFGRQPGTAGSSKSPNAATPSTQDVWMRNFAGGYVMAVQEICNKVALVAKYEYYDPNTKISADEVGVFGSGTGPADFAQQTIGFGALWNIDPTLRLTAYYDINKTETSANYNYLRSDINHLALPEAYNRLKSNIFTLRLQYKF